jgi:hypothetical protein
MYYIYDISTTYGKQGLQEVPRYVCTVAGVCSPHAGVASSLLYRPLIGLRPREIAFFDIPDGSSLFTSRICWAVAQRSAILPWVRVIAISPQSGRVASIGLGALDMLNAVNKTGVTCRH